MNKLEIARIYRLLQATKSDTDSSLVLKADKTETNQIKDDIANTVIDASYVHTDNNLTSAKESTWNAKADASHIHTGTLIFTYNL